MAKRHTSTARIPSEIVALAPDVIQHTGSAFGAATNVFASLALKLENARDAESMATATADYTATMDAAALQLETMDPRADNVDYARHMQTAHNKAKASFNNIKSKTVRDAMRNKSTVMGQRYEANAAYASIKKTGSLIRLEMADKRDYFLTQPDGRESYAAYLVGVGGFLTEDERNHAMSDYKDHEAKLVKEQSRQAVMLISNSNPLGVVAAINDNNYEGLEPAQAKVIEKALANLTPGQRQDMMNLAISVFRQKESYNEILTEANRQAGANKVGEYLNGDRDNFSDAQQSINELLSSENKDDNKLGKKLANRTMVRSKPPSEMAKTLPKFQYDGYMKIVDHMTGRIDNDKNDKPIPIVEELDTIRFDDKNMSQLDHEQSIGFTKVQIPPE